MNAKDIEDSYPLSPMQQAMLVRYQLGPRSGVYVVQDLYSFYEKLDVPAFQRAWEQVVTRHPPLRSSFRWDGANEPMQDVHTQVPLPFEQHDWRDLTAAKQESRLAAFLKLDRKRGFDFTKAPLARLALFRMGEDDYRLVYTTHHIIVDGWGAYIVVGEVSSFYDAYCEGQDLHLERPRPYGDHIDWLRQKDFSESEVYWRQLLKGFTAPTAVDVIPRFDRSDDQERYGEQETRLSTAVTSRLRSVAEQHQVTINTMVQGAWALLLSRYTGEDDIVFGAVRGCRRSTVDGAASIVGLFMNTLPVRVRIPSDQSLVPWLRELRGQHIAVRDHEQTPLSHVAAWSEVPGGTPLFESIVIFDRSRTNTMLRERGGKWLNREFRDIQYPDVPLMLHAYGEARLLLNILYDRRRFDDRTIERMLGHLKTLLEGMADEPDRPLANLPILTDAERHQLLVEWNDTRTDYPQDRCLHDLLEAQVERTPQAVALVFEGEQLTYEDLNQRANQLAHHLQRLGVGPETLVGVYMERSLEMIIALYGILKAGAAYVPLDPTFPADRIAFMMTDAELPVLLTQGRLVNDLPPHQTQVVTVDTSWDNISAERQGDVESGVTSDNLAYVIYTSGSTGKPKGVMLRHRNVVNFFVGMDECLPHDPPGVWLAVTTLSFDISVLELLWTLSRGFKVVIYAGEGRNRTIRERSSIPALIKRHQVTHFQCTPAMASMLLVDDESRAALSTVQTWLLGGEAFPVALAVELNGMMSGDIINMYGPTETTVWSSTYRIGQAQRTVPIGSPIANTQLYILDSRMQPVPVGITGELFIGGDGVARGYVNQPELTAERFVSDPFRDEPGARLYRTGDLVRYQPDGNIEFLGRSDHRVKVRGYRIELGEIESVLGQHPAVQEAVVTVREDVPGDKRLVAYVVPNHQLPLGIGELRGLLKDKLPDYMVPAALVQLEALPLTPNNKVDRRNLPPPEGERQATEVYVPPRNDLEKTIAEIWQELLRVDRVGVDDSYFDLGGHSLLAIQVMVRVREALHVDLPLRTLFDRPTVAGLAQSVERVRQLARLSQTHSDHAGRSLEEGEL